MYRVNIMNPNQNPNQQQQPQQQQQQQQQPQSQQQTLIPIGTTIIGLTHLNNYNTITIPASNIVKTSTNNNSISIVKIGDGGDIMLKTVKVEPMHDTSLASSSTVNNSSSNSNNNNNNNTATVTTNGHVIYATKRRIDG